MIRNRTLTAILAIGCTLSATIPAVSQTFPSRPVTIVVPYPAGGSAAMWRRQLDALAAAGHSAVALDLPGHGRSAGLCGPPTIEANNA